MTRVAPDNGAPENRSIRHSATAGPPPARGVLALDGHAKLPRELLGNKGHGIDAMRRDSLPVPPAFCITTEVGARFLADPESTMDVIWNDVLDRVRWLEAETSRTFGRGPRPLLLSVRSGAAQSMPGMMDTVLNLGMNDAVEQALAELSTVAFASDTRQRFTRTYRRIVARDKTDSGSETGPMPSDPHRQLRAAIEAVFASWNSPRAIAYRAHHSLDDRGGTAVIVQAMVFGNMGTSSGAGVVFSRNPITGTNEPFGEWLAGGQGDDVVSGRVDVEPISALQGEQPSVYDELMAAARSLERRRCDVQEIEFTVEEGRLWLLQTRAAERSAQAAVRLALQLRHEGLIDDTETLRRVTPAHVETLLQSSLQPETRLAAPFLAKGLPACPGVASGTVYTEVDEALDAADRGEPVILVRNHTRPDDVQAMLAVRGVVTEVGGASSHAAVVSRELGRVAVVGCGRGVAASLSGKQVTVDGNEGEVREGNLELTAWSENDTPELRELADIARRVSPLRAHTSGDYPRLDDDSAAAVRAAMTTGHTDVVSVTPLITMLTGLRLTRQADAEVTECRSAHSDPGRDE
jgi:pyruvate, orthophosphate dikinase